MNSPLWSAVGSPASFWAIFLSALAQFAVPLFAGAQSLAVVTPNGGDTVIVGQTVEISWTESGVDPGDEIEIEFTPDGSQWRGIDRAGAGVGRFSWTVPGKVGTAARVRVSLKSDGSITDMSDGTFVIAPDPLDATLMLSPNGGEVWTEGDKRAVTWQAPLDAIDVILQLSTDGGASWSAVATLPARPSSYEWTVAGTLGSELTNASMKVLVAEAQDHFDASDAPFTIRPKARASVTLLAPNGGERFEVDSATTITWRAADLQPDAPGVRIELSTNGTTWNPIGTTAGAAGELSWIVPNVPTTTALVRVVTNDGSAADTSDAYFSITPRTVPSEATIRISAPITSETWNEGEVRVISWEALPASDTVLIGYLAVDPSGVPVMGPIGSAAAPVGALAWRIPHLADNATDIHIVSRLKHAGRADTSVLIRVVPRTIASVTDARRDNGYSLESRPNPAVDQFVASWTAAGSGGYRLQLLDASGRYVIEKSSPGASGRTSVVLDVGHLGAGLYFLRVNAAGAVLQRVVTILR